MFSRIQCRKITTLAKRNYGPLYMVPQPSIQVYWHGYFTLNPSTPVGRGHGASISPMKYTREGTGRQPPTAGWLPLWVVDTDFGIVPYTNS